MEPEDSLPFARKSATGPYPEPDNPVHTLPSYEIHFNFILPSTSSSSSSSSSSISSSSSSSMCCNRNNKGLLVPGHHTES
jgi:hypothetical protein